MIDVDEAIRKALKDKDRVALTAYRAVKTKAGVKLTESGRETGKPLTEEEWLAILRREIKERAEANEYRDPADPDHAFDQGVIDVLERQLPQQPSPEETDALVEKAIAAVRPDGMRDMGKVMAALRREHTGLEMALVSAKVKERLGKTE